MRLRMSGHRMRILTETVEEQIWRQECKIARLKHEWSRLMYFGVARQELEKQLLQEKERLEELRSIRSDIMSQLRIK